MKKFFSSLLFLVVLSLPLIAQDVLSTSSLGQSNQLWTYVIAAVCGQVAHVLMELSKLEKGKRFDIKKWWAKNRISTVLGLVISAGVVFMVDPVSLSFQYAATLGYSADSFFGNLMNVNKDRVEEA